VTKDDLTTIRGLSIEKALAVAAYGESVAAYRYRTLAEKASTQARRLLFEEMADEEQGHHVQIQELLRREFPGSDFVLTAADKELICVGPRMVEVTDRKSFEQALEFIYETERLTGRFYAALYEVTTRKDLRPLLKEMADECFEHAERVKAIPETHPTSDAQATS